MSALIISMILAGVICWAMWRRPDARAAVAGAWEAGKAQAIAEFRAGYEFAQERLRAGSPRWYSPRRWASWGLAGIYGVCVVCAAANRIRRAAWEGGRTRYREWKLGWPIDAEVIEDPAPTPTPGQAQPQDPPTEPAPRTTSTPTPEPTPQPAVQDTTPALPAPGSPITKEEPIMQTEAAGLTSYAAAHEELAAELRERMSGSESLAASMSGVLAEHSDLIGNTAVLQDLLGQAAAIAEKIAERARTVASN